MEHQKIIIIGGGIGGLMTAIALNKKGIASSIYEKAKSFDPNGAGLSLWANATRILDKFGLLHKLMTHGNVLDQMKTSTSNGRPLNMVRLKKLEDKFHFPSIVLLAECLSQHKPMAERLKDYENKRLQRVKSIAKKVSTWATCDK